MKNLNEMGVRPHKRDLHVCAAWVERGGGEKRNAEEDESENSGCNHSRPYGIARQFRGCMNIQAFHDPVFMELYGLQ
jgi:hypothetical protein